MKRESDNIFRSQALKLTATQPKRPWRVLANNMCSSTGLRQDFQLVFCLAEGVKRQPPSPLNDFKSLRLCCKKCPVELRIHRLKKTTQHKNDP